MAISYPVSISDFADKLPVIAGTFYDDEPMEYARLGDGSVIKSSLGANLWRGRITVGHTDHRSAAEFEAMMSVIKRAGGSFFTYDHRFNGPKEDPNGDTIFGFAPRIFTLNANNRELQLEDLPVGYVISPGDLIGFQYGTSPIRYAVHRVVVGDTSGAAGKTTNIEVTPFIRPGAEVGDFISFVKPQIKATLINPQYGDQRAVLTGPASYEFIQTLR